MSVTSTSSSSSSSSTLNSTYASMIETLLQPQKDDISAVDAQTAELNVTQGILTDLGTKLSALQTALDALRSVGSSSPLAVFAVNSSNAQIADATATATAARGTHRLVVSHLAQSHSIGGTGFVNTGTSIAAGNYTMSFTVNGVTTQVNVAVNAGDNNSTVMANVAQAINDSGAGVGASVVTTDGSTGTQRLVLQSGSTGTVNLISNVSDVTGGLATQLGLAETSTADTYSTNTIQQAQNAQFNLDGMDLVASSNQVSDVLSGVTLNLNSESTSAVTINISSDSTAATKVVNDFITKYNDVMSYLRAKSAVSDDGTTRQELAGNSTIESFTDQLRNAAAGVVSGTAPGAPSMLADLGIDQARDGTLSITDSTKLSAALNASPAQVISVFTGATGIASLLYQTVNNFTGSGGGLSLESQRLTDLVSGLSDKKTTLQDRLDQRRAQLVYQFGQLQQLASTLNAQQVTLSGLLGQ